MDIQKDSQPYDFVEGTPRKCNVYPDDYGGTERMECYNAGIAHALGIEIEATVDASNAGLNTRIVLHITPPRRQ